MVEWLFLAMPWGCLRFAIVVFPDHTHLLFYMAVVKNFYPTRKFKINSYLRCNTESVHEFGKVEKLGLATSEHEELRTTAIALLGHAN